MHSPALALLIRDCQKPQKNSLIYSFFRAMLNPLFDHLIVEAVDPREAATASGIIIPDTAQGEKPQQGHVTAAGPGKMLDNGQCAAMSVKVGDTIVFKKYAPDEVKVDGKEYLVISESDVLAIVTK